jgi:REP element-mobilizing transposase RayT
LLIISYSAQKVIVDAVEIELKKILAETCEEYGWKLETMETIPDHVHMFIRTDHMTAPVEIAKVSGQEAPTMVQLDMFRKRRSRSILKINNHTNNDRQFIHQPRAGGFLGIRS